MRKNIYICDQCKEQIGDVKHFYINFNSGVAIPPNKKDIDAEWDLIRDLSSGNLHFCCVECLTKYFRNLFNSCKD